MVYSLGGITHTPYSAEAQKPCVPARGNLEGGESRESGILRGVFGKAGTVIRYISPISYSWTGQASPAFRRIGEQVEFGEWKGFLLTVLERRPKHKQEG